MTPDELREKVASQLCKAHCGEPCPYGLNACAKQKLWALLLPDADAAIREVVEACAMQLLATMLKTGVKVIGPGDAVMAIKSLLPKETTDAG